MTTEAQGKREGRKAYYEGLAAPEGKTNPYPLNSVEGREFARGASKANELESHNKGKSRDIGLELYLLMKGDSAALTRGRS